MQRDEALRQQVSERLAAWPLHAPDETGLKRAAVALVIADEGVPAYGDVKPSADAIERMLAPVLARLQTAGVI